MSYAQELVNVVVKQRNDAMDECAQVKARLVEMASELTALKVEHEKCAPKKKSK